MQACEVYWNPMRSYAGDDILGELLVRMVLYAQVPSIQVNSFSLTVHQILIAHDENARTSLPHPHYTHSPNNAESASNLTLPS